MPKAPIPLDIPPGIFRNGTPLQAKPRWYDSNLVRWVEGALEPQGGWQRRRKDGADLVVSGAARAAFGYRDNDGVANLAVGTHTGLYIFRNYLDLEVITPAGLTSGGIDSSVSDGYGMGDYGEGDYGMPAEVDEGNAVIVPAAMWCLDNFGEELIGLLSSDGTLYHWSPDAGFGVAVEVMGPEVPINNTGFVVTNERMLMALGANGNPRLVKWSAQESLTDWAPTPLNQAGEIELQTNGEIIAGRKTPDGVIIWTSEDVHIANYLGFPFVYGFKPLAGKCSLASARAMAVIDSRVVWAGNAGFWIYDGYLQPLASDIGDDLYSHINVSQMSKMWAMVNHDRNEVVWFYPSDASNEIDSYATWNYHDNYWIRGKISRLSGVPGGIIPTPVLIDAQGHLYNHNVGYDYEGGVPFIESWPIELGEGDRTMLADCLIPDERQLGDVRVSFKTRQYPTGPEISYGPFELKNPTNFRVAARSLAVRFEGVRPASWRIGRMRMQVKPLGKRPLHTG